MGSLFLFSRLAVTAEPNASLWEHPLSACG